MKRIFSFFIPCGILLSLGFVNPDANISPKVLDAFTSTFSDVKNAKWYLTENLASVYFDQGNIKVKVYYDLDGKFLSSMRYYDERNLPFNVLLKIKSKYKGKTIGLVTEVIADDSISYTINIEDEKEVYVIKSGANGVLELEKKFKKQEF